MLTYLLILHNVHYQPIFKIQSNLFSAPIRSSLCDFSDAYIRIKGTITVARVTAASPNNANKKEIFKNCAPFTSCTSRINNTQVDDARYTGVVMPIYNSIEYSDNYSKTSGILQQYCRNEQVLAGDGDIADFNEGNTDTNSFKIKEKITDQTSENGTKNIEIMTPLKYVSNFWRTFEIPLINCEINLDLNLSENCVKVVTNVAAQATIFPITDTKL